VTSEVRFELELQMTQVSGFQTNGVFLFGQGPAVTNLVRVEVLGGSGRYAIAHGTQRVETPFAPGVDPFRRFAPAVTYDPATGQITLRENGVELSLILDAPPSKVDTMGIAVNNARTVFSPIQVQLPLGGPPRIMSWRRENGQLVAGYLRESPVSGAPVTYRQSPDLVGWNPAFPVFEQSRDLFGQRQDVETRFAPGDPDALAFGLEQTVSH
jgi:hypothetical protein